MDEGNMIVIDRVCSSLLSLGQMAAGEPPPMIHFAVHAKRQRPMDIARIVLVDEGTVVLALDGKAKRKKILEILWHFVYPNGVYYDVAVEKMDATGNDAQKYAIFVLFPLVYAMEC